MKGDAKVSTSQLLCTLIVESSSRAASEVAKTTSPSQKSQKSSTLNNGAYKPTVTMSTSSQSSLSPTSTVTGDGAPADSHTIWIHVGVGIAALVIVVVIGILVSLQFDLLFYCFFSVFLSAAAIVQVSLAVQFRVYTVYVQFLLLS